MCSTTQNNFVSVNNSMYNFMEDYNSLDDKNIDTIKGKISNIRSEIDYLDSLKIDALKVLINTNRDWYENQLYYLNKELDKLEELQPTDNTLYGKLGKTVGDINKFKKYVNDLKVTKIN